jgi:hypothetical protein
VEFFEEQGDQMVEGKFAQFLKKESHNSQLQTSKLNLKVQNPLHQISFET